MAKRKLDSCMEAGKKRHRTRKSALNSAAVTQKHVPEGVTIRTYKCPHCRDFHLTHHPQHIFQQQEA